MKIMVADARNLPIESESVHLVVTSPPYNVGMEYDTHDDSMSTEEYREFTKAWMTEAVRILVDGGRMCINIANTGRKPYTRLNDIIANTGLDLGLIIRGEAIWYKGNAICRGSTAWGSFKDATNPVSRDCHEYIEIFSKKTRALDCSGFPAPDITRTEFANAVNSVWEIPPTNSSWHPAPFPIEIPTRCVKLYTRPGMTVLDPFCGTGTTLLAAKRLKRKYIGADISKEYVQRAISRLGGNLFG